MERLTADEYEAHAQHNERFLEYLIAQVLGGHSNFADWGFVVAFYAALHYTKAHLLRKHGEWARDHMGHYAKDDTWIEGHNDLVERRLPTVYLDYKELFDLSIQARYGLMHVEGGSMFPELKRKQALLARIKATLQ